MKDLTRFNTFILILAKEYIQNINIFPIYLNHPTHTYYMKEFDNY